ncbi:MAG: FISUMP domain-containing protein [Alistipes sp.]|nr:FISUMP domain-containing protein [Alistipes sp.]
MKIFKYLVFSVALLGFAACQEVDISERDQATRVTLSPLTTTFDAKATTYVAAVQVNSGSQLLETSWNAEVTSSTPWVTLSKTSVEQSYTGTYDTETVYTSNVEGISVSIAANTEYKRTFEITVTTADGTAVPFTFTQKGAKADAKVTTSVKKVEFLALGGSEVVSYSSNMGDVVAYSFKNGDGSAATWLKAETVEAGKVKVTAEKYENKEAPRSATMTITVGSAATSLASVDVPVVQLAAEDHYFVYGASVADIAIEKALQMDKTEKNGVFTLTTFFNESANNAVVINKDSRELTYPCFALATEGKVVKLENKDTKWTGPAIEANGVRTLTIDFNALTWSWERVTNQYAMPDELIKDYPTKEFIARDGSKKVWMVKHMAWDGGNINPKLGSGMVKHEAAGASGSGGYAAADFPATWNASTLNSAWETKESGLGTLETYSDDGRVYAYHEMLGYEARFGIGYARYEQGPWVIGEKYTDARGITFTIAEAPLKAQIDKYTGDNAKDEELYPMLRVQAQGICPYGWHVANAADWLDLFYAMSQASKTGTHTYPVAEADCTYKQMINGGVPNINGWLRNTKDWGDQYVDEGADEFGFQYYPLGFRYMTQGFQCWSMRAQLWVPLPMAGSKPADYPSAGGGRINVVIKNNKTMTTALANLDIGQAVCPFRCVKNYK